MRRPSALVCLALLCFMQMVPTPAAGTIGGTILSSGDAGPEGSVEEAGQRPIGWYPRVEAGLLPRHDPVVEPLTEDEPDSPAAGPLDGTWALVPRTWPVETAGFGMAHDVKRGNTVVFGGCCVQGDTWLWDGRWTRATPASSPSARAGHSMAYDPIREEIVLFGGTTTADTWTWDGQTWHQELPVTSPPFRNDASMAFDPAMGTVVLFGGYPTLSGGQRNDIWAWDGSTWTELHPTASPPPRYAAGMAFDPISDRMVVFGGIGDCFCSLGDTWAFDGTTWTEVVGSSPAARSYVQMALNEDAGWVELFGGYVLEDGFSMRGDSWRWDGASWVQVPGPAGANAPPGRCCGGFVYDATTRSMLLFDGSCSTTCGGLWSRHGQWRERARTWPLGRLSGGFAEHSRTRSLVLFGGCCDSFGSGNHDQTWIWDGERWHQAHSRVSPPGRQQPALAYHRRSQRTVLFGGCIGLCNEPASDTWTWDGRDWREEHPRVVPPGRSSHGMAKDPRRNRVVMFGGYGGSARLGDTWTWDGRTWHPQEGSGGPPPRLYPAMEWDPMGGRILLFGGSGEGGTALGDTWAWNGQTWTELHPPSSPPARLGATLSLDRSSGQLVLFGGATCGSVACVVTNETWTWNGTTWLRQAPAASPGARWFAASSYHSPTRAVVLFGGHDGGTGLGMSDTWEWLD